jgi:hypothetical protein
MVRLHGDRVNWRHQDIDLIALTCRGDLPRVVWATGYGPKLLDMIGSIHRHTGGEPYTPYQETTPPL